MSLSKIRGCAYIPMCFPIVLHWIWKSGKAQTEGCASNRKCAYDCENTVIAKISFMRTPRIRKLLFNQFSVSLGKQCGMAMVILLAANCLPVIPANYWHLMRLLFVSCWPPLLPTKLAALYNSHKTLPHCCCYLPVSSVVQVSPTACPWITWPN